MHASIMTVALVTPQLHRRNWGCNSVPLFFRVTGGVTPSYTWRNSPRYAPVTPQLHLLVRHSITSYTTSYDPSYARCNCSIFSCVWQLQLEYNAQEYLEMQHKLARKRPRLGRVE